MNTESFPVDAVYTWVNHLDPQWQKLHEQALASGSLPEGLHSSVNDPSRFQNRGELYYSIRSLRRYAPWVRRVFVVTNCALPDWAASDPWITRVDHSEIFPNAHDLPTFNAFAIEACLHRIDGLAEHFLYFNDDVFLLREASIDRFFPDRSSVSVFASRHDIPREWRDDLRPVEFSMIHVRAALESRFGFSPGKKLEHAPFPLLKSVLGELESEYADELAITRSHAFRDRSDYPLSTTLHAYHCVATGRGRITSAAARYIDIGDPRFVLLILPFSPLLRGRYEFLCLNEVNSIPFFPRLRDRIVVKLMKHLFD